MVQAERRLCFVNAIILHYSVDCEPVKRLCPVVLNLTLATRRSLCGTFFNPNIDERNFSKEIFARYIFLNSEVFSDVVILTSSCVVRTKLSTHVRIDFFQLIENLIYYNSHPQSGNLQDEIGAIDFGWPNTRWTRIGERFLAPLKCFSQQLGSLTRLQQRLGRQVVQCHQIH